MVCQDEWTRLYPSERYEWRGRSCFYKAQWNQCDTFAAVCAATCKAKDCGAELAPLRTSVLHRQPPPAPPRASWQRRPPLPSPIHIAAAPATPPATHCPLRLFYHVLHMTKAEEEEEEEPHFRAAVEISPWDHSRVVHLVFSSPLKRPPTDTPSDLRLYFLT